MAAIRSCGASCLYHPAITFVALGFRDSLLTLHPFPPALPFGLRTLCSLGRSETWQIYRYTWWIIHASVAQMSACAATIRRARQATMQQQLQARSCGICGLVVLMLSFYVSQESAWRWKVCRRQQQWIWRADAKRMTVGMQPTTETFTSHYQRCRSES